MGTPCHGKGWRWIEQLLPVGTGEGGQGDLMVWERLGLLQVAQTRLGMASMDSAVDVDAGPHDGLIVTCPSARNNGTLVVDIPL